MVLVRVSLLVAHPEVRELDINPLLADETGVALDARVRIPPRAPRRAIRCRSGRIRSIGR